LGGFETGAVNVNEVDEETPIESQGFGKLLIPGAVIAAVVGAGIFIVISGRNEPKKAASEPGEVARGMRGQQRGMIELAPASMTAPVSIQTIKSDLMEITEALMTNLDSIKDSESAERALPRIKEIVTKIDAMGPGLKSLSSNDRSKVDALLREQMEKLNPVIDRTNAMQEIGNAIQPLLEQAKKMLARYGN
jgi:hypothetical protein